MYNKYNCYKIQQNYVIFKIFREAKNYFVKAVQNTI